MNIKRIILDLDGVLINFHKSAFASWGVPQADEYDYPIECGWDIVKALNKRLEEKGNQPITPDMFWNSFGYDFWSNLLLYDGAKSFYKLLNTRYDVCICTSAAHDPMCAAGKVKWLNVNLPDHRRRYFIGCQKHLLATPRTVLIDDADHNVKAFREAGGVSILVPRPWNSLNHINEPYPFVMNCLRLLDPVAWRVFT